MPGSVQKRKTEIALWEMDEPESRRSKRGVRKRQGDVDIIDLYPNGEIHPVRTSRSKRLAGADRPDGAARRGGTIEPVWQGRADEPDRRGRRTAEPVRRSGRAAEPVRRNIRTAESVGRIDKARTAASDRRNYRTPEPAGRRRPAEEAWEVDLIGQDYVTQPQRRKRTAQSKQRRRVKKKQAYLYRTVAVCMTALCLMIAFMAVDLVYDRMKKEGAKKTVPVSKEIVQDEDSVQGVKTPDISEDFLDVNDYSRPGTELPVVNSVFVHYTANPGTSARQNRSYFANLAETHERSASAHFIIGYEGEIIQCIPLEEQAYAVMTRNEDSISIECCYLEDDGEFTQETYDSLVHLLAWLEQEYHLGSDDILRHYDCGGKKCPLYYVEHEDEWERLLSDVDAFRREQEASSL